jgi:hypothetical protein
MAKVEVGAGALVAGAGLAVWGSFQSLFEQMPNNPGSQEYVVTSWTRTGTGGSGAVLVQWERVRAPQTEEPVVHRLPDGEDHSGPA